MNGLKITKDDEVLFAKVVSLLKGNNRISAMIVAAELSSSMVKLNNPTIDTKSDVFFEVAERFADSIYNDAKKRLGMDLGIKAKRSDPVKIKRSVQ